MFKQHKIDLKKQLLQQELSKVDYTLSSVLVNKGISPLDNPLPFEDKFSEIFTEDFNTKFQEHLSYLTDTKLILIAYGIIYESLKVLYDSGATNVEMTQALTQNLKEVDTLLSQPFGVVWSREHESEVNDVVTEMYNAGLDVSRNASENEYQPNEEQDRSAISQLVNVGIIYGGLSVASQIMSPVTTRLTRDLLVQGLDRVEAQRLFAEGLKDLIPLKSQLYYDRLASVVVGRARNYGRVFGYQRSGVVYVESLPVGDDRTCERCIALAGVYRVDDVAAGYERAMAASTLDDLVNASPFVNGIDSDTNEFILANGARIDVMSDSEALASVGIAIPYHVECRCEYRVWRM